MNQHFKTTILFSFLSIVLKMMRCYQLETEDLSISIVLIFDDWSTVLASLNYSKKPLSFLLYCTR